jgi:hypothetical protein
MSTNKLERLLQQKAQIEESIRKAKDALRKRNISEQRKRMAHAIDAAMRSGVGMQEIEAALSNFRAPKPAQTTQQEGEVSHG